MKYYLILTIILVATLTGKEFHDQKGWFSYQGIGIKSDEVLDKDSSFVGFYEANEQINCVAVKRLDPSLGMMFACNDNFKRMELTHNLLLEGIFANHKGKVVHKTPLRIEEGQYVYYTLSLTDDEYLGHISFYNKDKIVLLTYSLGPKVCKNRRWAGISENATNTLYFEKLKTIYRNFSLKDSKGLLVTIHDEGKRFKYRDSFFWMKDPEQCEESNFSGITLFDDSGSLKKIEASDIPSEMNELMADKTSEDCLKGMLYILESSLGVKLPNTKIVHREQLRIDDLPVYFAMLSIPQGGTLIDDKGERGESLRGYLLFFMNNKYVQLSFAMHEKIIEFREKNGLSKYNNDVYLEYLKEMFSNIEIL